MEIKHKFKEESLDIQLFFLKKAIRNRKVKVNHRKSNNNWQNKATQQHKYNI